MKVLVIGGGMAGLTYAIIACKNGIDVTVAERNSRVGKKIAMSGNGKCNIGNANVSAACYNKSDIVNKVLAEISVEEYRKFLTSCGIYTYTDSEGRMYPLSDSASNVVDCLRNQLARYGAKLLTDTLITSVEKRGSQYEVNVNGNKQIFDKVVLACGSGSQAERPNVYSIVPADLFAPTVPSLVPVKIHDMPAVLNGLRAKAEARLYCGEMLLGSQSGEVLFKDYGLSGICIFNLSALIARREVQRKKGAYTFSLDVVPNLTQWQLQEILHKRLRLYTADKLFYGILHNKLGEYVVKRCGLLDATELANAAKNLTFSFDRLLDWSMSQVTSGGIAQQHVDLANLTLPNGIVTLGEILDVDGICGGNNLFFAAASALSTFSREQRERAYLLS